ncbi:MAG: aminotransferase class I/II-fold pyridoxal phosphate-dependent enzyme, partial [Anaerolineae bacterium]|nr:aminotransferase class I/II-fold pyridoxal phosphate-dependent enzyme [Anaerolineae bacterium]
MKLPPFKLERYFARYEFAVEHLLCCSDCESMAVGELLALEPDARGQFEQHWLGYTESLGAPSLRAEIACIYQTVEPEQVLVFSGAEEAIFLFAHTLLGVGDHLIVHWPCYQSLAEVARSVGCQVSPWIARRENGWALDPDDLEFLIRPSTKAIIVNTPHNPTGYLMPKPLWAEVNRIAQAHGLVLFSDEVYRESEYAPGDRLPAACDVNPVALSLGVMSKTYGLAGLRIG